jgi:hypothetical protein
MFSKSSASALSISAVPAGVPTHSSNRNYSASRKRLKLGHLSNATIGDVAKIGECCTRMPSVDGLLDGLLLFVNIFSMTIRAAVLAQQCFGQMPCGELLLVAQGSSEYPCRSKPAEKQKCSP